jgi:DNA (cytosine-5)-methyltransferase 1
MTLASTIPIVDLFAGPGGLGEGFSSLDEDPFRILVSAEMDASAHATLRLRAFYRVLKRKGGTALDSYYNFCNTGVDPLVDDATRDAWGEAEKEALQLTLGAEHDNRRLDSVIVAHGLSEKKPWLLIGGPPCQAYSLVGRARNRGKVGYSAESDHRHFLYREYLRIIQKYRPAVFVMENVKGILSSKVDGERIFPSILRDLADPDLLIGAEGSGLGYRIHSLSSATFFDRTKNADDFDARDFIVRAELHGVPQARHRVILLGVREDIEIIPDQLERSNPVSVRTAIEVLPKLRSKLSKQVDSSAAWMSTVQDHMTQLAADASNRTEMAAVSERLIEHVKKISPLLSSGGLRMEKTDCQGEDSSALGNWYSRGKGLRHWLNHETRGHMSADLRRYAYAATFAEVNERSPKGHGEFDLVGLRPNHLNWESGKFSDRFRVQIADQPATTVTSHISKDGHYFIHYDPLQCRSLTVREAARLQTFPDNYFFEGGRTQQFHQVGNAVPPFLAHQIAKIVLRLFAVK